MRRSGLKLLLAGAAALASVPILASGSQKADRRLLGTWRSDKERTMRLWRFKKELDTEQKAKFESIFGKMTRRFTSTHAYSEFDGETTSNPYRVLGADEHSVVVAYPNGKASELQQIFFEDDWFYVVSGYNVEFFRRVTA